jgi:hypothetical protein
VTLSRLAGAGVGNGGGDSRIAGDGVDGDDGDFERAARGEALGMRVRHLPSRAGICDRRELVEKAARARLGKGIGHRRLPSLLGALPNHASTAFGNPLSKTQAQYPINLNSVP